MTIVRFPDGTERDVPEAEVDSAVNSGGFFPEHGDAVQARQELAGPSMIEDPVGAANALASGAFRGAAIVGGDAILDNASELVSQLRDDYSWQNRMNEAMYQHQGLTTAGRVLGNVVTGVATATSIPNAFAGLGTFGGAVATNAAEAGIVLAMDGATDSLSEDMLERPDITSEAMAANALSAAFWGGAKGVVFGGLSSAALLGAARGASALGGALRGAGDDAVDAAVRTLDDTPEGLAAAARAVREAPASAPLSAAVRMAEREGVEAMTARVYREAVEEISTATRHVASVADIPESMIRASAPDGHLVAQAAGTNVAVAAAQNAHEAMARVAANEADGAALNVLNMARQRAIMGGEFTSAGSTAAEMSRQLTTVNRLTESLEAMSPAAREVASGYINKVNGVFGEETIFGTVAANATRVSQATQTINAARTAIDSGTALTREQLSAVADAADVLSESYSRGATRSVNPSRVTERAAQASQRVRSAVSQVDQSLRVAALAREVANARNVTKMGTLEEMAVEIGSRAIVGGNPMAGAAVERLYRSVRDSSARHVMIHRAQNLYQSFRARSAQSLLNFSANPRPVVSHLEFSPGAYNDAVDAVKRAADIPVARRARVNTEVAGEFQFVPTKWDDIPSERGTLRDAPPTVQRAAQRRSAGIADTIPPTGPGVATAQAEVGPVARPAQASTGADAAIPSRPPSAGDDTPTIPPRSRAGTKK